jgi:hypothetical protein
MAVPITLAMQNQIAQNYIAILGRNPDPSGFSFWVQTYADANGTAAALTSITNGFGNSAEFKATYTGDSTSVAVGKLYQNVLLRAADADGLAYWTAYANNLISSGQTISNAYAQTGAQMIYNASSQGLSDAAGINARTATAVASGTATPTTTYTLTTSSPETITALGANNVINGTQATFQAGDVIVGKAGAQNTLSLVDSGTAGWTLPAASVSGVQTISLRNINGSTAAPAVAQVVQLSFAGVTNSNATAGYSFANVATAAVTITVPVVSATTSGADIAVSAAAAINAATGSLYVATVTGAQVTLTARAAGVLSAPTSTLTLGIGSTGGASNVAVSTLGAAATTSAGATDAVTAGNFTGATLFINDLSTNRVDYTGLTAAQTLQINGNGVITNGATNAQMAATSTVATLVVNGGVNTGAVAFTSAGGTGIATVSLTSTGTATGTSATAALGANVLTSLQLNGAATVTALNITANNNLTTGNITGFGGTAATITVTGTAGALNIGTLEAATVRTVNASAFAGGLTVTLNANAAIAFTGGNGNDTVTTGAVLTTGTVNGGGGTGDTLVVGTNLAHVNTAALAAKYTNFETLSMNGLMDASLISGLTKIELSGATNTVTNLSSSQSVVATAGLGATTLAPVSGTTNTLNLQLGSGLTTDAVASAGVLTVTGYQTLNLNAAKGPTTTTGANQLAVVTGAMVGATIAAVNLTGTAFQFTDIATTLATTFNGSALTGNGGTSPAGLRVAGTATAGSSIVGSGVADRFTIGGATAATYDGGLGNDVFETAAGSVGSAATDPTLTGGAGTDIIRFTDNTVVDADFRKMTGFETLNFGDTANTSVASTAAIAVSGLSTNANAAFATGLTVTSGTLAATTTYSWESLAYANNVTINLTSSGTGSTADSSISITTGAGNDSVTVDASAAFVGAVTTLPGTIAIATGSGVDTITLSTSTLVANTIAGLSAITINAGTGADVINVTTHVNSASAKGNIFFVVAAGDSTTTAWDQITGFKAAVAATTISDGIDFAGTSAVNVYTATAATGYTAAQLSVAVASTGLVTLSGTAFTAGLTLQQTIDAVQSVVATTTGDTALFTYASAGVTSTYVFNNNTVDSVVQLVGVSGVAVVTTNNTTVNNIFIQ